MNQRSGMVRVSPTNERAAGGTAFDRQDAWELLPGGTPELGTRARLEQLRSERVQRKPNDETSEPAAAPATSDARPTLLRDDDAATVAAPGQMRKSEFLAQLRSAVHAAADEALASTGQTSQGCPWLDYWLGYY